MPEQIGTVDSQPRSYLDQNGKVIFVSAGIGHDLFGTFRRKSLYSTQRVKSPGMPMVASRAKAQANLDAWAAKKGLQPVDGDDQCQREQTI